MLVRMRSNIGGYRNGEEWPRRGGTLDVPDHEGRDLIAAGHAEEARDAAPIDQDDHATVDHDAPPAAHDDADPAGDDDAPTADDPVADLFAADDDAPEPVVDPKPKTKKTAAATDAPRP